MARSVSAASLHLLPLANYRYLSGVSEVPGTDDSKMLESLKVCTRMDPTALAPISHAPWLLSLTRLGSYLARAVAPISHAPWFLSRTAVSHFWLLAWRTHHRRRSTSWALTQS